MSGKFVFIPDDGEQIAFQVTLDEILRLTGGMTVPNLACEALEQVLSGCGWVSRATNGSTCYVIKVFPELDKESNTWEPMIHFTFVSGVAKELSMSEFLHEYYPITADPGMLS